MPHSLNVLFTFAGGAGHLTPLLPLAAALRAAGHRTGLAGNAHVVEHATGFDPVFPYAYNYRTGDDEPTGDLVQPDLEAEFAVIGDYFVSRLGRTTLDRVGATIDEWRPDVLVCDEMDFGAMVAAERAGVPRAVVKVIASGALTRAPFVETALRALREGAGLSGENAMARLDDDLVISPFPPSFRDPDFPLPASALSARPAPPARATDATDANNATDASDAVDWFRSGGNTRARIYFTLGTVFNTESGDLFGRVLDGLAATHARVLVTVGRNIDPRSIPNPHDNVRVERFVDQNLVMGAADLVVSHGGSGSVIGALSHGIPVVALPLGADQELNGHRIVALGVGTVIDPVGSTPDDIGAAALQALGSASFREAAERLRDEIARLPAPDAAVEALVRLARGGSAGSPTRTSGQ